MRRPAVIVALGVMIALTLGAADGGTGAAATGGGTLRIFSPGDIDSLDPGLANGRLASVLMAGTCMTLMSFREEPSLAGYSVRPEAAAKLPQISRDGLKYEFTLREGLRFSDGSPLTARNFAVALGRVLDPAMRSYGAVLFSDVKRATGRGLRLQIELSRPGGDLLTRLALSFACPVPLGFPIDPAGVPLMVGSGPFYVAQYLPGKVFVLQRNRYYIGPRERRIERLVMTIGGEVADGITAVEAGQSDILAAEIPFEFREELAGRYGINKRQLFRARSTISYFLALNTARPLFRDNVALRKAVNLALDRGEIRRHGPPAWRISHTTTDQLVPRSVPGWVDHRIYPLTGPDLRLARSLAAGNMRDGKVVFYTSAIPFLVEQASVIAGNLRELGLEVEVKSLPPAVLDARAGRPGEPYDLMLTRYFVEYPDPANVLIRLLAGENARRPVGNTNFAYFDNAVYNRRLAAAHRLSGTARLKAFSTLEADLLRNEAPVAPLYEGSNWLLVSKRVGCVRPPPARFQWWAICLQ